MRDPTVPETQPPGLMDGTPPSGSFRLEDVHFTVFRQAVTGSVPYVVVRHDPTGVVAAADESPSQKRNERVALERLRKNVEQWERIPISRRP